MADYSDPTIQDSPVYNLRQPNAAALGRAAVPAATEKIEIAPHPTTNRFPWAPVENPTVAVYQAVTPPRPQPVVMSQPPPVPQPVPVTTMAPPPPTPVQQPVAQAVAPAPALAPALPQPPPHPAGRPLHVYSHHTRVAWRMFRPAKFIRLMWVVAALGLLGSVLVAWMYMGSPTNLMDVEFLQPYLNGE